MAKWEQEELLDVDNDPFNPDDEPDWTVSDDEPDCMASEEDTDPFDPTGEDPIDLFGLWWE